MANVCTSRSINPVSKRLEVRISEPSLDLTGLSFNALLLGLYLSHGDFKSSSISLLGGVDPWKVVVKGVGPVLFSVATTTRSLYSHRLLVGRFCISSPGFSCTIRSNDIKQREACRESKTYSGS